MFGYHLHKDRNDNHSPWCRKHPLSGNSSACAEQQRL